MCHLCQKFISELALNGLSKFWGSLILKSIADPVAISTYPVKSKYIWKVKDIEISQLSKTFSVSGFPYPISTKWPRLSAISIFFKNPIKININPIEILLKFILLLFLWVYCGTIWLYLTIGPAINCGKKITNKKNFLNSIFLIFSSWESIKKAITWKVTKLKANGNGNSKNCKLVLNIKFIFRIRKSVYLKIINIKTLNDIKYTKTFFFLIRSL